MTVVELGNRFFEKITNKEWIPATRKKGMNKEIINPSLEKVIQVALKRKSSSYKLQSYLSFNLKAL